MFCLYLRESQHWRTVTEDGVNLCVRLLYGIRAGGLAAGFGPVDPSAADAAAAGEGASGGLSLTAHALMALAAAMGAPRPEPYAIGPISAALGECMASRVG